MFRFGRDKDLVDPHVQRLQLVFREIHRDFAAGSAFS